MSDNLGLNQSRVLDTEDRNFESVTYQWKKPPLSSEKNLDGSLYSLHAQNVARSMVPSGMYMIGDLKNGVSESLCNVGDILTSSSFSANTLKLIALDKGVEKKNLIAWVNGWKLLLQGTNSLDENNIIILNAPPTMGNRIDFVFLEVWRKLIYPEDTVYKYGNFLYGGTNPTNDLVDPAIGIETSLRIQTQYRIRVAGGIDIETFPSGFDPNYVFVQGPLANPVETCSQAYFTQVPGDAGLWRAGAGDSAAQEALTTVDGYTYAIPLCAIHRRSTLAYDPDNASNGAGRTLAQYLTGYASDRPDNQYSNYVVSSQILDMRKRVAPSYNLKEICESGFQKLTDGKLRGKMEKSTLGGVHFGAIMVQADAVEDGDSDGSEKIATGDGVRRIYANAEMAQPSSLLVRTVGDKTPNPGLSWQPSDSVFITNATYPVGTVISSVEEIYTELGPLTDTTDYTVSGIGTALITITIPLSGSALEGTSYPLTIDYTINFASGSGGLTAVPDTFLEFRKVDSTASIASTDADIRVRQADPVVATDGTHFNMLSNKGGSATEHYNFGHQITYHFLGNGTSVVYVPRYNLNGYDILGVISVSVNGVNQSITSVVRNATIYTVDLNPYITTLGDDIELVLYTGVKFFATNKQGRAITDCYEMLELTPIEAATGSLGTFTIDSTNKAIQAIGSALSYDGAGMAYVDGVMTKLSTLNNGLPTDSTKSRATIDFSSFPGAGVPIEVPVLVKSAITPTEGYTFFYERVPYQGLLDSTATGAIEAVGPALTTTAGSGAITDFTYTDGSAKFVLDATTVTGFNTEWLSYVQAGYQISVDSSSDIKLNIASVYDDNTIFLSSPSEINTVPTLGENYTITAPDQPSFGRANIIDRLPTSNVLNDGTARSEDISTAVSDPNPVLETRIISKVQDMVQLPPNTATMGVNPNLGNRGRTQINMPAADAPLGLGNLGLRFEKLDTVGGYQKTYQSYILNKDNDGSLYLMVVGSETGSDSSSRKFSEFSNNDSVDIFELPGRPLLNRRTQ